MREKVAVFDVHKIVVKWLVSIVNESHSTVSWHLFAGHIVSTCYKTIYMILPEMYLCHRPENNIFLGKNHVIC